MSLTIDIEGEELVLTLPAGRSLAVPATAAGLGYIKRILQDARRLDRASPPRGYIAEYPTQHVIDIWIKQDRAKRAAAQEKYGIELGKLDISL